MRLGCLRSLPLESFFLNAPLLILPVHVGRKRLVSSRGFSFSFFLFPFPLFARAVFTDKLHDAVQKAERVDAERAACVEFEQEIILLRKRLALTRKALTAKRSSVARLEEDLKKAAVEVRGLYKRVGRPAHCARSVDEVLTKADVSDEDENDETEEDDGCGLLLDESSSSGDNDEGDFFIDTRGVVGRVDCDSDGEATVSRPAYTCISELPL
jgi:hypothetical protein